MRTITCSWSTWRTGTSTSSGRRTGLGTYWLTLRAERITTKKAWLSFEKNNIFFNLPIPLSLCLIELPVLCSSPISSYVCESVRVKFFAFLCLCVLAQETKVMKKFYLHYEGDPQ